MRRCSKCKGRKGDWIRDPGATVSRWEPCENCAGTGKAIGPAVRKRLRDESSKRVRG